MVKSMDVRVPEAGGVMSPGSAAGGIVDLHRYIAAFRRRQRLFLGIVVAVFALAMVVTYQITPRGKSR
jgi:uncharacterized protein involved in exopolysaccharide biosynthesis